MYLAHVNFFSSPNKVQIERYETDILYFYLALATARLRFSWQIIYPIAKGYFIWSHDVLDIFSYR